MTLWQAIEALQARAPFSAAKVEAVLNGRLTEVRRSTNTVFLEGGAVPLSGASRIAKVDLRLGLEAGDPGFLALDVDGKCITLEQVRSRYGQALVVTNIPRGRSVDEATTYSAQIPWGNLSFGFQERNPQCLAYVVLEPQKGGG